MKNKHFLLGLTALLLSAFAAAQSKCNCSITPYKPDSCFSICAGFILRNATDIDLQLVLGLDQELSKKILEINKDSTNATFKSFLTRLNGQETEKLIRSINTLNKQQNDYLIKPLEGKKKIMANMEKEMNRRPG